MKVRRKTVDWNWDFDGKTITVHIPMTFQRRSGRKMIIAPDGREAWAPAKPRLDNTLIRALARAGIVPGDVANPRVGVAPLSR